MTTDRKVWLLTQAQYDGALAALCEGLEDGTTADIGADLRVVLHLEHDPDTSISDYDGYGKTEKYAHRYVHGESRTPRPDDFDGSARKIEVAQGYWIWWQPADDMKSFKAWGGTDRELYEKAAREHYEIACRLLRDGFMQLGVELQRKCGADHWHEVETAWLGGVDADPYDAQGKAYLRELIGGQMTELAEIYVVPASPPPVDVAPPPPAEPAFLQRVAAIYLNPEMTASERLIDLFDAAGFWWHPDTPAADLLDTDWRAGEVAMVDALMGKCFRMADEDEDLYGVALDYAHRVAPHLFPKESQ